MRAVKFCILASFVAIGGAFLLTYSGPVAGQSGPGPIDAPTGVTATDDIHGNRVAVYWDVMRNAAVYRVFRSAINDPSTAAEAGTTTANYFIDRTVPAGQTTFYWVRAENPASASPLSESDQGSRTGVAPQGALPLEPPVAPPPNGNALTGAKIYLGKALFWDEQMSSTKTVSCGTCHHAGSGGTDPRSHIDVINSTNPGNDGLRGTPDDVRGSRGVPANEVDGTYRFDATYGFSDQVTGRKSMSHVNSVYSNVLFWDGRATGTYRDPLTNDILLANGASLESQAAGPPVSDVEMAHTGGDWSNVAARINDSTPLALSPSIPAALSRWIGGRTYGELFNEAFGSPEVTPSRIAMAIASYERTLFSDQTPFDIAGFGSTPLTAQEQRGRNIFNASACATCHGGALFSDNTFRYIGVRPQNEDTGRFQVTGINQDLGSFRVPSLRNVELRGSFFHNGQFTTLEQVVAFYNRGGDFNASNKAPQIRPLGLNQQQQADLVAFLKRPLTDPRVAAEAPPFDRPVLYMESDLVPQITGSGRVGSGGVVPAIKAVSPALVGNQQFTVSVSSALGNSPAVLVIDPVDPGVGSSIPPYGALARISTNTHNTGAGNGWASVIVSIPDSSLIAGRTYFARWYIQDPSATNGFAVSEAARFTVFGNSTSVEPRFTISGSVAASGGQAVRNAIVNLLDAEGNVIAATVSSSFGVFSFDNLLIGDYRIAVSAKRFRFTARPISVASNMSDINLNATGGSQ